MKIDISLINETGVNDYLQTVALTPDPTLVSSAANEQAAEDESTTSDQVDE